MTENPGEVTRLLADLGCMRDDHKPVCRSFEDHARAGDGCLGFHELRDIN